jgi:predicted lipase
VHSGFQTAYSSIASQVISAVKDELSSSGYSTLTITGHSLGAGLSSIATSSFIGSGIKVANTYTYGEPRNGDLEWVSYLGNQIPDENYFRVTHYNDGVPQIPPTVLGFAHHGPEYWQSKKSGNSAATTFNCGANSTVRHHS